MSVKIYLDNNATTPLDPRVLEVMLSELSGPPANPSSAHLFGQRARGLLTGARDKIASCLKIPPEEILFTSGGTEGLNLLLRGVFTGGHWITTAIEHSAVYETIRFLELRQGLEVTYLPTGRFGAPLLADIESAMRPHTRALVFSAANNETGVKIDLEAIADLAFRKGIPLLLDAVALFGKEPLPLYPGIAAFVLSGHKFHAPKGTGLLFKRSSLPFLSPLTGGPQEYQKRPGTENLAGILGLAKAIEILSREQPQITHHLQALTHQLEEGLKVPINGLGPRVPGLSNLSFPHADGETLLLQLDLAGIAASHGSACSSGALEPSRVLLNMGLSRREARSSLRFSLSRFNTRSEIDQLISKLK